MSIRILLLAVVFCMTLGLNAQEDVQEVWVGQEYKCDLNSVISDVAPFNISWDIDASIFSTRKDGKVCYVTPKHYFSGTVALTCKFSFLLGGIPIVHEPVIWYFSCIDNPLSISPAEMRLTVGETGKIRYSHSNDAFASFANVTFASDNQSVAIVSSDGTVNAVKEGSTRIAVHSNLAKEDQYCRIIVEGTAPLPVITFNEHQLEMDIDKTATIGYSINPSGSYTVTWSSSDENVATVTQSGKVKALSKGKATITAKINGYDSSDACDVTVKAPRPTSIDIPDDSYSIFVGESLTVNPVVKPEGAEYTLGWISSDPDVATVTQTGIVTAKNVGETRITATIQGANRSDYCYVYVDKPTLTLQASLPSGVINKASKVSFTASDRNAQIWYTLDGSSPVTSGNRKLYSSSFTINQDTKIKAVAVHPNYHNSDVLTLNYTLRSAPGDVNQDGEANIADINAIIDVVLDGADDVKEYQLCDVNNDSEVNIADINTDVDVILNPEKYRLDVETFVANGVEFNMVYVEGGTFTMGTDPDDDWDPDWGPLEDPYEDAHPAHEVTVYDFQIGQTEVTQELWEAVMGSNPSSNSGLYKKKYPVENVSWYDCQEFITKLNKITGKSFRLPTEAEWEFAARGGNLSKGNKYVTGGGWYWTATYNDANQHTIEVGNYSNELGLSDMAGNVSEWCQDWYDSYHDGLQINPFGSETGTEKVIRGSSYILIDWPVYKRAQGLPDEIDELVGLRLVLSNVEIYNINDVSFAMIPVQGGTFTMGATPEQEDEANWSEYPAHKITVPSFSIGQTEVSQALWAAVNEIYIEPYYMGYPYFINMLTTGGVIIEPKWEFYSFISKLNEITGKSFRLPFEEEWEFAARGGNLSQGYKYAGSNEIDDVAWYDGNSSNMPHHIMTKAPNELGLYDMSGNVLEQCEYLSGYYSYDARGGSWYSSSSECRVSSRFFNSWQTSEAIGLRLASNGIIVLRLESYGASVSPGEITTINILGGSGTYKLSCDDPSIASCSIENNQIIINGENLGTTTITITDALTNAIATICVTVVKIQLDKTTLTMQKGETQNLNVTIEPIIDNHHTLFWSTDNSNVIRIKPTSNSTAEVSAINNGVATITIKFDNSNVTAKCTVSVKTD